MKTTKMYSLQTSALGGGWVTSGQWKKDVMTYSLAERAMKAAQKKHPRCTYRIIEYVVVKEAAPTLPSLTADELMKLAAQKIANRVFVR